MSRQGGANCAAHLGRRRAALVTMQPVLAIIRGAWCQASRSLGAPGRGAVVSGAAGCALHTGHGGGGIEGEGHAGAV